MQNICDNIFKYFCAHCHLVYHSYLLKVIHKFDMHSYLLKAVHKFSALFICFVTDHVLLRHWKHMLYPENCNETKNLLKRINFPDTMIRFPQGYLFGFSYTNVVMLDLSYVAIQIANINLAHLWTLSLYLSRYCFRKNDYLLKKSSLVK